MGRLTLLDSARRSARRLRAARWTLRRPRRTTCSMRKRRTTLPPPADEPEPETDGASPSKRRAFGKKVAAAVSRIEAVDAAAKPVGEELPRDRQCAFCGQRGNKHGRGSRQFINWQLCLVLYDEDGRELRRPRKDIFPVLGAIVSKPPAASDRPAERQPRYPKALQAKRAVRWPDGGCPTPHWACWACCKIARNSVRAVGEVSTAVDLPAAGTLGIPGHNEGFVARVTGSGAPPAQVTGFGRAAATVSRLTDMPGSPELVDARQRWQAARIAGQQAATVRWTPAAAGPCHVNGWSLFADKTEWVSQVRQARDSKLEPDEIPVVFELMLRHLLAPGRAQKGSGWLGQAAEPVRAVSGLSRANRWLRIALFDARGVVKARYLRSILSLGSVRHAAWPRCHGMRASCCTTSTTSTSLNVAGPWK